jgi:hypothetical protein
VVNVKSKHSRDAQNVKVYGIAQESAKLQIGQTINKNVIKKSNKFNKWN